MKRKIDIVLGKWSGTFFVLILIAQIWYWGNAIGYAEPVQHCQITEFAVRGDSTYYQVDCGQKAKIANIVEKR